MTPPRNIDDAPDPRELLVPYVLGELDDRQRDQLEQQLASDAELRAELRELESTSLELLMAAPQHAPPPALKARVLDAIDAATGPEHQAAPAPVADVASKPAPAVAARQPARADRGNGSGWLGSLRERFTLGPAFGGAFAVGCLILLALLVDTRSSLNETRDQLAAVQQQAQRAPAMTTVSTNGPLDRARGKLVRDGDQLLLVFEQMPSPGEGASWQVWTADKQGQLTNVAQWTGSSSSHVVTIDDADSVDEVMVSREQTQSPVEAPSGAPVAAVAA